MTVLANTFEGGSNGTVITAANSGATSGDAFDNVYAGGTGSAEYDTDITINDSVSALLNVSSGAYRQLAWIASMPSTGEVWTRMYFRVDDPTPAANTIIQQYRESDTTTIGCDVRINTGGTITLRAPSTARYTSTTVLSADTVYRLEVHVVSSATVGHIEARLFYGANLEGTTPDESFGSPTANWDTGNGTVGGFVFGVCTNPTQAWNLTIDDVAISDASWIGPSGSVTPPPAGATLANTFEGGVDGTTITVANSGGASGDGFDFVTLGAGSTAVYDDDIQLHGTYTGLLGTTGNNGYVSWDDTSWAGSSVAYARVYFRVSALPGSNTTIANFLESDGTTVGCEVRLNSAGTIGLRAPATTRATSTLTVSTGTWYRLEVYVVSNASTGSMTARLFTGANLEGTTPDETVSFTGQDTGNGTVGGFGFGMISAPGSSLSMTFDNMAINDSDWLGGTDAAPPTAAASAAYWGMFAGFPIPPPTGGGSLSAILEPETGAWFGVTAAIDGQQSSTNATGLAQWEAEIGVRPQIMSFYQTGPYTGSIATSLTDPGGGLKHAIPFVHWKVGATGVTGTWADVANGAYDTQIDNFGAGISAYGHPVFFSIFHEPEDNVNTGSNTKAWYKAMWQHVRDRLTANGVTNLVYVLNYVGYSGWADSSTGVGFEDMYPGDAYVDWIAWDPYADILARNTMALLLNENYAGEAGWTGFYNWATTYHADKPLMIAEFGINMNAQTDSQAAAIINNWTSNVTSYPAIRAWVYWNAEVSGGINAQIQGETLASAALATMVGLSYFDQDPDLAL